MFKECGVRKILYLKAEFIVLLTHPHFRYLFPQHFFHGNKAGVLVEKILLIRLTIKQRCISNAGGKVLLLFFGITILNLCTNAMVNQLFFPLFL